MRKLWLLLLALAVVLGMAQTSDAQFRFGVGVGGHGSGVYFGNTPYYGGYGYGHGYGYSPYGYGYSPYGYGLGYGHNSWYNPGYSGGYSRGWPSYYSTYTPSYYSSPGYSSGYAYGTPSSGYQSFYPANTGGTQYASNESQSMNNNTVFMEMRVPPNAEVWFNGTKTQQTGMFRQFVSPQLEAGKHYTYDIRVTWNEEGRQVARTRKLDVHAGDRMSLDFLAGADTGTTPASDNTMRHGDMQPQPAGTVPADRTRRTDNEIDNSRPLAPAPNPADHPGDRLGNDRTDRPNDQTAPRTNPAGTVPGGTLPPTRPAGTPLDNNRPPAKPDKP